MQFFFFQFNMGPYVSKKFKQNLFWKYTSDALSKNHAYSWGGGGSLYQIVQKFVKFQILDFCLFFFFLLTWDHMGVEVSNDISGESIHQICSPNFM